MRVIKYLRQEAGFTGSAMARAMGTTQPAFSAWENGKGTMPEHRREIALELLRADYPALEFEDLEKEMGAVRKAHVRIGGYRVGYRRTGR